MKRISLCSVALLLAPLSVQTAFAAPIASGGLVINEIRTVEPATDDEEFIELYNASGGLIDFSASPVSLEFLNPGTVYDTVEISTGTLAAGDYLVIAGGALVPNTDIVDGPATNFIQNGDPDGFRLRNGTLTGGAVIDAVQYFTQYDTVPGTPENGAAPADSYEGGGGTGAGGTDGTGVANVTLNTQIGTAAVVTRANTTFGRFPDGADTDNNRIDFQNLFPVAGSPGLTNSTGFNTSVPFSEDFSQATGLSREWSGAFTPVILETAASATPAGIPPSPDSVTPTEWASVKDNTGGGDSAIITDYLAQDYTVRAYFYCGANTSTVVSPDFEVGALMARNTGQSHRNNSAGSGSYDITTPVGVYGNSLYALETNYLTGDTYAVSTVDCVRTVFSSTNIATPGWHEFAIRCEGGIVEFAVDGVQLHLLTGQTPRVGYTGVGYRENQAVGTGTVRANFDGFRVTAATPVPVELSVFSTN